MPLNNLTNQQAGAVVQTGYMEEYQDPDQPRVRREEDGRPAMRMSPTELRAWEDRIRRGQPVVEAMLATLPRA